MHDNATWFCIIDWIESSALASRILYEYSILDISKSSAVHYKRRQGCTGVENSGQCACLVIGQETVTSSVANACLFFSTDLNFPLRRNTLKAVGRRDLKKNMYSIGLNARP